MTKFKNKTGYLLTALFLVLVGAVASAQAELVTYYFTGKITDIEGSPPSQYGQIDDSVTGSIAYDPSLPPAYDTGEVAGYIQLPPGGMSVVIEGATITTLQSTGSASLQVINDYIYCGCDNFNGYFAPISVNGQPSSHSMNFSLTDHSATVFDSTTLPDSLDVGSFDSHLGAIFAGFGNTVIFSIDTLSLIQLQVTIDVKPGSFPNSINPESQGQIPVAIVTTGPSDNVPAFDAATVDPATVRFGSTGTEAAPVHFTLEDVNGDGDLDLVLLFETQETGIQCGDTSTTLTAETFDGQSVGGTDSIKTVGGE